jgi:hypothetical protein
MELERQFDELIRAGWQLMDGGYSERSFQSWRKSAFECLLSLLGPDHSYTNYFEWRLRKAEAADVLTGVGVLTAAKLRCAGHDHGAELIPSDGAHTSESWSNSRGFSHQHVCSEPLMKSGACFETDWTTE